MYIHKCPVLGRACCQRPIRPATFRRDVKDLLYQGRRAARALSTLRPLNISCLRVDVQQHKTTAAAATAEGYSSKSYQLMFSYMAQIGTC